MPDRQQTPADPGTAFQLGKIEGQLRELIHTQNNQVMKGDAMAGKIGKLETLPDDLAEIKTVLAKVDVRLTALETDKHRRDGAGALGAWLLRTPLLGWVVGIGAVGWAAWKGLWQ